MFAVLNPERMRNTFTSGEGCEWYLLACFVQAERPLACFLEQPASEISLRVTAAQQHPELISATGNRIRLKSALNHGSLYTGPSRHCLGRGQSYQSFSSVIQEETISVWPPQCSASPIRFPSGTLSVVCHFDCSLCKSFPCIAYLLRRGSFCRTVEILLRRGALQQGNGHFPKTQEIHFTPK